MQITPITKQDTTLFKAIGILLIVFHNYFRWVEPNTGENEFGFSTSVIKNLFSGLIKTPLETVNLLFDCFGHYGVQIFIFISGVGLTISLLNKKTSYGTFILKRLKSIYAMLIVGLVFYFFAIIIMDYHLLDAGEWKQFLWKFLLIHTLIPGEALSVNGPWWFFGLIFQLYLLLPLLFWIIKKYNLKGFIAVCLFSFACTYSEVFLFHTPEGIDWMANAIAHLPEFAFGIFIAMNVQKKISPICLVIALVVFMLGNVSQVFFPLTFLAITVFLYFVISKLIIVINKSKWIKEILLNIGTLSMAIFIVHGFFRWRFIAILAENWYIKIIGALLFFVAIYGLSIIANILYKRIYNLFKPTN